MKKLKLQAFKSSQIPRAASSEIKGGQSFCEWYFDYCSNNGLTPSNKVLNHFMLQDQSHGNNIPPGFNMSNYENRLNQYYGI